MRNLRQLYVYKFCIEFTTSQFIKLSNQQLNNLYDKLEQYQNVDTNIQEGVLNININGKQWVINRQTPNKQLWYSSPISGPQRFNWQNGKWLNNKNLELEKQLINEINIIIMDTKIE